MHLPYIAKCFNKDAVKIIPIMTGPIDEQAAAKYGKIFAPYFEDKESFFIFSTDFCHWGSRFDFTYWQKEEGDIWRGIEKLDGEAMIAIQNHSYKEFEKYMQVTKNTICGRHPLFIMLKIIESSNFGRMKLKSKFVKYSQSAQVKDEGQSSVSYAAGITYLVNEEQGEQGKT